VRSRLNGAGAWLLATLLPPAVFLLSLRVTGKAPFGPNGRSINDLGYQFEPMHALLRDLLHGASPGGWQLNWTSGLGVPFLPDYATYLASPFALFVVAVPRDAVPAGLVLITAMKYAAASVAMLAYLRARRPGGPLLGGALLSSAYALCGWAIDDASYGPMWLDGLVGLPLLALAGWWALVGRRPLLTPLLVAVVWWANFYTAWMATLGAGLLTLAAAFSVPSSLRSAAAGLLRAVGALVLGVASTAVILLPTLLAVRAAQPSGASAPVHWTVLESLSRLLPQTEGVGASPGLFVGTTTLVLALALPWVPSVPARERWPQSAVLAVAVVSIFWGPTMMLWHGFDTPQGSPFREAFVICGLVVVGAWLAANGLVRERSRRGVLGGIGFVAVLVVMGRSSPWVGPDAVWWVFGSLATLLCWLELSRATAGRWRRAVDIGGGGLLAVLLVGELLVTATHVSVVRDERFAPIPPAWSSTDVTLLAQAYRVHHDAPQVRGLLAGVENPNAPMLYGLAGAGYYSSLMPETTARMLAGLGHRVEGWGRRVLDTQDPVIQAVEASSRVVTRGGPEQAQATRAFPVVRVLPDGNPLLGESASDPAMVHRALTDPAVVSVPEVTLDTGAGAGPLPATGVLDLSATRDVRIEATCPEGAVARLWIPDQGGLVDAGFGLRTLLPRSQSSGAPTYSRNGLLEMATTGDGRVSALIVPRGGLSLPEHPVSCVDETALVAAITRAETTGPSSIDLTRAGIVATWERPVTGRVLVATSAMSGWSCTANDRSIVTGQRAGLLTASVTDARSLACTYQTPGLTPGALVSLAALALIAGSTWLRRRGRPWPLRARRPGRCVPLQTTWQASRLGVD
jgi:hypothetical protein